MVNIQIKLLEPPGSSFSMFKFAFLPELKAQRLNITDMDSTGDWMLESDEIGGIREYSTKQGSSKSLTIEAPKLWVYNDLKSEGKYHLIKINQVVDTKGDRKDGKLLWHHIYKDLL